MVKSTANILSIDVGSVAVSVVELSPEGEILNTFSEYHHGQAADLIAKMAGIFDFERIDSVVSPSGTYVLSDKVTRYDAQASLIKCFRTFYKDHKALLLVL